jgi:hypothetical protein
MLGHYREHIRIGRLEFVERVYGELLQIFSSLQCFILDKEFANRPSDKSRNLRAMRAIFNKLNGYLLGRTWRQGPRQIRSPDLSCSCKSTEQSVLWKD